MLITAFAATATGKLSTYLNAGWNEADVRDHLHAYHANFSNQLQFPYLRIPGAFSYWQSLNVHLGEAALRTAAVDFEEITLHLGRERQRSSYRKSLGL